MVLLGALALTLNLHNLLNKCMFTDDVFPIVIILVVVLAVCWLWDWYSINKK